MIVAGLQLDVSWEYPPENFERVKHIALPAVQAGAPLSQNPSLLPGPRARSLRRRQHNRHPCGGGRARHAADLLGPPLS